MCCEFALLICFLEYHGKIKYKMMAGQGEPDYCTNEYNKVQGCAGNSSSGSEGECKSTDKDVCDGSSAYKTCENGYYN